MIQSHHQPNHPHTPQPTISIIAAITSDPDGFNRHNDSVGPGIYGGNVVRNHKGQVEYGQQYENHNPLPGPIYAGTGYTEMTKAIQTGNPALVKALLTKRPELVHEVATGGATPLHLCGMSKNGQAVTQLLIDAGADINVIDTYGYKPLHRMASNNLAIGAVALLGSGANAEGKTGEPYCGDTPMKIAINAGADQVKIALEFFIAGLGRVSAGVEEKKSSRQ